MSAGEKYLASPAPLNGISFVIWYVWRILAWSALLDGIVERWQHNVATPKIRMLVHFPSIG